MYLLNIFADGRGETNIQINKYTNERIYVICDPLKSKYLLLFFIRTYLRDAVCVCLAEFAYSNRWLIPEIPATLSALISTPRLMWELRAMQIAIDE